MGERGLPDGWKCLSSRYLARDPWHTVREESLELPDGRRIPRYYVWEYPEWVNIIARTEDGAFVMIRQYRHAAGETSFELPAGTCESSDADLLAAARRELLEETGFGGGRWRHYMTLSANPATHANRTHTFLAEGVSLLAPPVAGRRGNDLGPSDAAGGSGGAAAAGGDPAGIDGGPVVALFL